MSPAAPGIIDLGRLFVRYESLLSVNEVKLKEASLKITANFPPLFPSCVSCSVVCAKFPRGK